MNKWFLCLLLVAGGAQAVTSDEFAYGLRLELAPGEAVYELELPAGVYSNVTRADLGDVRVFNGTGDEVPHILRRQGMVQGEAPAPQAVPLFPIYGEQRTSDLGLRVQTDANGAVVELKNSRPAGSRAPSAYLIDLSAVRARPTAIELQWHLPAGSPGFVASATVSASDDLASWRTVGEGTVGDLGYGGNHLERRQIDLDSAGGKYLRIEWPEEARSAVVDGAQVRFAAPASYPSRRWMPVDGVRDEKSPGEFRYASGGFFPVDCVRVVAHEANTAVRLTLASRADAKAPWRVRGEGMVYNLTRGSARLASDSFCFEPTADREWQVRVTENGGGFGRGVPGLELGWNPQRLLFVARGEGPFMLAYGSSRAAAGGAGLDPLLQDLESQHLATGKATVSDAPFALGGPSRLEVKREVPWQRLLLWGLLVGGVGGLSWMAWRLARDLNRPAAG
jgi:hypothetical protein